MSLLRNERKSGKKKNDQKQIPKNATYKSEHGVKIRKRQEQSEQLTIFYLGTISSLLLSTWGCAHTM